MVNNSTNTKKTNNHLQTAMIVDHPCLEMIVCFLGIDGIVDHRCLEVIVCFVGIGGIVDHRCLGDCLFCWYWWNFCGHVHNARGSICICDYLIFHWLSWLTT
jgi:hypothetical protein